MSRPDENDRVAGANAVLDALQTLLLGGHLLPGATTGYVEGFTVFAEASLHRYRPVFRDYEGRRVRFAAMAMPEDATPRLAVIGTPA